MSVTVKCFASLREQVGFEQREFEFAENMTVAGLWRQISNQPPPPNLLCACNLGYVDFAHAVCDGDEVAFFPPVTGG